jgi:hypothetical protein
VREKSPTGDPLTGCYGEPVATAARDQHVDRHGMLEFLRPRHRGILVTTRRDGRPQLSPVTMGVDDEGRVVVASYPERAKVRNARRRTEVIDLPDALDGLVEYFRSISGEHPDWEEYRAAMQRQGKVLLRLTIERWGPISRGGFPPRLLDN